MPSEMSIKEIIELRVVGACYKSARTHMHDCFVEDKEVIFDTLVVSRQAV